MKTISRITVIIILAAVTAALPACLVRDYSYAPRTPSVTSPPQSTVIVRERTPEPVIRERAVYMQAPKPVVIHHQPVRVVQPAPRPAVIIKKPVRITPPRPYPARVVRIEPGPSVKIQKFSSNKRSNPNKVYYSSATRSKVEHYGKTASPAGQNKGHSADIKIKKTAVRPGRGIKFGDNRAGNNAVIKNKTAGSKATNNRISRQKTRPFRPEPKVRKPANNAYKGAVIQKPGNRHGQSAKVKHSNSISNKVEFFTQSPMHNMSNPVKFHSASRGNRAESKAEKSANQPKNRAVTHIARNASNAKNKKGYAFSAEVAPQAKNRANHLNSRSLESGSKGKGQIKKVITEKKFDSGENEPGTEGKRLRDKHGKRGKRK